MNTNGSMSFEITKSDEREIDELEVYLLYGSEQEQE